MPNIKKSEQKLAIREEARRKIRGPAINVGADKSYRSAIEKGHQRLNQLMAEGGDSKAKRVRQELMYLINNYLPSHETRIEQLIDDWRRTGDPSYDPGIRIKLRQAQRDYMSKTHPV